VTRRKFVSQSDKVTTDFSKGVLKNKAKENTRTKNRKVSSLWVTRISGDVTLSFLLSSFFLGKKKKESRMADGSMLFERLRFRERKANMTQANLSYTSSNAPSLFPSLTKTSTNTVGCTPTLQM